jgi:hypothetical protein
MNDKPRPTQTLSPNWRPFASAVEDGPQFYAAMHDSAPRAPMQGRPFVTEHWEGNP